MIAKRCDRCGKFYNEYNIDKNPKEINAISLINCDARRALNFSNGVFDLCPPCSRELLDWLYKYENSKEEESTYLL